MKNTTLKNIFLPFLLLIFFVPTLVAQNGCCVCFFSSGNFCSPNVDATNCNEAHCNATFPAGGFYFAQTHNVAAPSCAGLGCPNIMPIDLKIFEVSFT